MTSQCELFQIQLHNYWDVTYSTRFTAQNAEINGPVFDLQIQSHMVAQT